MKHPILTLLLLLPLACYSQWGHGSQGNSLITSESAGDLVVVSDHPMKLPSRQSILLEGSFLFLLYEGNLTPILQLNSLTYAHRLYQTKGKNLSLSVKSGVSVAGLSYWGIPVAGELITGQGNNHFEATAGAFVSILEVYRGVYPNVFAWPIAEIGYRYQKPEGGLVWKVKVGTTGLGAGVGWAF